MPPQGLLLIAAVLPDTWETRFIDENMSPATGADFDWADVVFVSGMHIQRQPINEICERAHLKGKPAVLGGPSVSACPGYYPKFDYLHLGELGDATDKLIALLIESTARPPSQIILRTGERRDLAAFPEPAYELAKIDKYFLGSIQFSSGCPYTCEFCDIPGLYGRVARLKTPEQILAELDKLLRCGVVGSVYFVDDNFVANRKAMRDLLPHLIAWQKRNGYAISFACEATLNIARSPEILVLMREAGFDTIFCGIETPEPGALKAMDKQHNLMLPILDAVRAINRHGMEVVSGIIVGLDSDTAESGKQILDFVSQSQIPLLTINLLQALPGTPLWDRLEAEGRLSHDASLESNVVFRLPYEDVIASWRQCMEEAYRPEALFARYKYQMRNTYKFKLRRPFSRQRYSWKNIKKGMTILGKVLWTLGVKGDYRAAFWDFTFYCLIRGQMEPIIRVGLVAHHLISFARDACAGKNNASHYSEKVRSLDLERPVIQ